MGRALYAEAVARATGPHVVVAALVERDERARLGGAALFLVWVGAVAAMAVGS
jgi:hypothetical protein